MDWEITTTKGAIYEFGSDDIVKGNGYISSQCCGSTEIELGTIWEIKVADDAVFFLFVVKESMKKSANSEYIAKSDN